MAQKLFPSTIMENFQFHRLYLEDNGKYYGKSLEWGNKGVCVCDKVFYRVRWRRYRFISFSTKFTQFDFDIVKYENINDYQSTWVFFLMYDIICSGDISSCVFFNI